MNFSMTISKKKKKKKKMVIMQNYFILIHFILNSIMHIRTNVFYQDVFKKVEERFDTSNQMQKTLPNEQKQKSYWYDNELIG